MIKNQSNKEFLELLIGSGVRFFSKNQPNNFYMLKINEILSKESKKWTTAPPCNPKTFFLNAQYELT